jgi:predicted nucleotidyltransferase component of viral defense system
MISDAEIRRAARRSGVEPSVIELDWALGWALWGLAEHGLLKSHLLFKGGTCLRKCYFPDYRFSEDLDFTATAWLGWDEIHNAVRDAFRMAAEASGIDFDVEEPRFEVVDDEYGRESLKCHRYWRGPHRRRGAARALRLDITRNEIVATDPIARPVHHEYSDLEDLGALTWRCYSLEEVMAEKLRAVLGQRKHAIARDLYDLESIQEYVDHEVVRRILPAKLAAKDLDTAGVSPGAFRVREAEFRSDWTHSLLPLIQEAAMLDFDSVWSSVLEMVEASLQRA